MDEQEAGVDDPEEVHGEESSASSDQAAQGAEASSPVSPGSRQEGRPGDALAWLEGPAFNPPIEELPTLQWPAIPEGDDAADHEQNIAQSGPEPAEPEPGEATDELDEAIGWLDQLDDGPGTPVDEMPTLVTAAKTDATSTQDEAVSQATQQIDSDPMAWLEQLAIDQSSPLEELPSVADRLLASDIISQIETGQDVDPQLIALAAQATELDKALSYLEQLAEAQGISLDDVSFDQLDLDDLQDETPQESEQITPSKVPAPIVATAAHALATKHKNEAGADLAQEMPEDPDEALAWLADLEELEEEATSPGDIADAQAPQEYIAETTPAIAEASAAVPENKDSETEQIATETVVDAEFLDEMPDDPDQAMAWMAGLAAHQAASRKCKTQAEAPNLEEDAPETDSPIGVNSEPVQNANLALAQEALASGKIEEANDLYRSLLDNGHGGPALIEQLETAVSERPEEPELLRLLGDAYMQDGQLQKALRVYKGGFDHL